MTTVNVHEAKTNLSRLLDAAAKGEEIIIAKAGKPVARLIPIGKPQRTPGSMQGTFVSDETFFDPLPENELDLWNGEITSRSDPLNPKKR